MFDDLVYDLVIFNKGNNAHGSPELGTDEGIDFIDLLYHLSPTFGGNKGIFIFNDKGTQRAGVFFSHLSKHSWNTGSRAL